MREMNLFEESSKDSDARCSSKSRTTSLLRKPGTGLQEESVR